MLAIETVCLIVAALLLFSILASKASSSLGIPALLLFLLVGMLAGSEGLGGIYFDDPHLTQSLGVLALTFILFAGGLDTNWRQIRPVLAQGMALANLGVLVSAVLVGGFAVFVLGFGPIEGVLLGAIVSSTDAAAVFSVVRERGVKLVNRIEPLLELESGSNDPIAVFLTAGLTHVLTSPHTSIVQLVPEFALEMVLGAAFGYGIGWAMHRLINRVRLSVEGLYPVLTIALVVLTYGLTASIGGNGFLAVYIAGIMLGNRDFVHKRSLKRFHDGIAWLMQIAMFLVLGMQVFPSRLLPVAGMGLLVSVFLIFVARPLSVFGALALSGRSVAEKLMISWAGLRGAVPIVLATFPLLGGVPRADTIFHLVFFIVLSSVLVQGTSIPLVARWLKVNYVGSEPSKPHTEYVPQVDLSSQLSEVLISAESRMRGKSLTELQLPKGALVILVYRGDTTLVPSGATVLRANDRLLVLAAPQEMRQLQELT